MRAKPLFAFLILLFLGVTLPLLLFTTQQKQEIRQHAAGSIPLPPDTTENIHLGQYDNSRISDPSLESSIVDVVESSRYANQPSGMYNTYYFPFDHEQWVGNGSKNELTWFQQNHPDWIVYKCDKTTPAYLDGTRTPLCF